MICSHRLAQTIVITAWLMFLVSFFLPVTNALEWHGTPPGTPLNGWQASFCAVNLATEPMILLFEPRMLMFLVVPILNITMLFAPLCIRAVDEETPILSVLFVVFGGLPWLIPKELTDDVFCGFYVWDAPFFLMATGCYFSGNR